MSNNIDMQMYEQRGNTIEQTYLMWFGDIYRGVEGIIKYDGINYKLRSRSRDKHKRRRR